MLTVTLAGFSSAQERELDFPLRFNAARQARIAAQLMEYLGPRIDHIAESVANRYQLRQIPTLRESAQAVLKQDDLKALFRDASNAPSLEPFLRAVLARHLSERQLEDYLAFTKARKDRDRNAVAGQLLAWADQHLSLNSGQRNKLRALFLLSVGEGMTAQKLLSRDADTCMDLAAKLELDVKRLEGVLSSFQIKVWELTIPAGNERAWWRKDPNPKERDARFAAVQADIVKAFEAGRITRAQAAQKLEAAKKELWVDPGVRRDNDAVKQEERIRLIVAAKLAAHTEQLGELDALASKRLTLVTKGVVEQVIESWDTGQRDDPTTLMMDHPLYQQTIKDVLSEDAYVRYQVSQAQRVAFRDRALRDLVVAYLDTQLLLSEMQRNDFADSSAQLIAPTKRNAWALLVQVLRQTDHEDLSLWQRELAEGILKAGARWER